MIDWAKIVCYHQVLFATVTKLQQFEGKKPVEILPPWPIMPLHCLIRSVGESRSLQPSVYGHWASYHAMIANRVDAVDDGYIRESVWLICADVVN